MGKREDYEAKTEKLIMPIVEANNVELFDVDYYLFLLIIFSFHSALIKQ